MELLFIVKSMRNDRLQTKTVGNQLNIRISTRKDFIMFVKDQFASLTKKNLAIPITLMHL